MIQKNSFKMFLTIKGKHANFSTNQKQEQKQSSLGLHVFVFAFSRSSLKQAKPNNNTAVLNLFPFITIVT